MIYVLIVLKGLRIRTTYVTLITLKEFTNLEVIILKVSIMVALIIMTKSPIIVMTFQKRCK